MRMPDLNGKLFASFTIVFDNVPFAFAIFRRFYLELWKDSKIHENYYKTFTMVDAILPHWIEFIRNLRRLLKGLLCTRTTFFFDTPLLFKL